MSEKGFQIYIPAQFQRWSSIYTMGYKDGFQEKRNYMAQPAIDDDGRELAYNEGYKMGKEVGEVVARLIQQEL